MVAEKGDSSGQVSGRLWLKPQSPALRDLPGQGNSMPLFGGTDVAIERVGAVRMGDLASADSTKPGVAVLEQRTPTSLLIVLRLGSDANERGVLRFDGGYAALTVRSISDSEFRGTWASGVRSGLRSLESSGYFCATRLP
jgi:hypothetical protein